MTIEFDRKWAVMSTVGAGVFLGTVDGSIVNIALPTLVRAFHSQFAVVQWVVLAYLLTMTTLMLSAGRLADIFGKKPLYATGMLLFTLGSALCGAAQSIYWLISSRVLQGLGAVMMTALGAAILTEAFPPTERGKALGINGAVVSVGIITGPVLGGFILDSLSWHWIFFVNVPVGLCGTLMAFRYLPPDRRHEGRQRFDLAGAALLFVCLISLLLALTLGQQRGFSTLEVLSLLGASGAALLLFTAVEWRSLQPMVDLRIFKTGLLSLNLLTGFFSFVAVGGTILLMPFYLENILGCSPRQAGILLAAVPVALGITSPLAGTLSDRFGTRTMTALGLLILAAGYAALTSLSERTTAATYFLLYLPIGVGMGVFQSPNNSAIMGAAPAEKTGIISGMLALTRTLGQTTGIALIGAFWASRALHHAGADGIDRVSQAPAAAQVTAIEETFLGVAALMSAALVLSLWGWCRERRPRYAAKTARDGN